MKGKNVTCSVWSAGLALGVLLLIATASIAKGPPPPPPPPDPSIVFLNTRPDIQVMNPDGSYVFTVLEGPLYCGPPAWSPDATQNTLHAGIEGVKGIYVVNIDGTGLHMISPTIQSPIYKAPWSPVPCPDDNYWEAFQDRLTGPHEHAQRHLPCPARWNGALPAHGHSGSRGNEHRLEPGRPPLGLPA